MYGIAAIKFHAKHIKEINNLIVIKFLNFIKNLFTTFFKKEKEKSLKLSNKNKIFILREIDFRIKFYFFIFDLG